MAVIEEKVSTSELIHTLFERLNDHNPDLETFAADELVEEWPMVGRLEGRTAVENHIASVLAAAPDFHIDVERMVVEGEVGFVHWHMTGTFSGNAFNGIAATGRPIDLRGTDYFTVREGKVVSNFVAYDAMGFAVQVGVLPAPDTPADRVMKAATNAVTALRRRLGR